MKPLPSRFYAMVDPSGGHPPEELARVLLSAGARVLQLRLKAIPAREFLSAASAVAQLCRAHQALFIVNDRADIAMLAGADGVHLGQEDLPLAAARALVGPGMMIGISTHSIAQALAAERGGADYVGFGPMFAGGTKHSSAGQGLDNLRAVRVVAKLPIVAIGGITQDNAAEVLGAGADAVAIISDVVGANDIAAKVRALVALADRR